MKSHLMFACSFLCLAGALYLGYWMIYSGGDAIAGTEKPQIVVRVMSLERDVHAGDIISSMSLSWKEYLQGTVQPDMITKTTFSEQNTSFFSIARDISAGNPVRLQDIIWPADSTYLEKTLRAGKRAISVSFDTENSLVSVMSPGSIIDIVYTGHPVTGQSTNSGFYSEIVAHNIRVLDNSNIGKDKEFSGQKDNRNYGSIIILEVDDHDAKILAQAQKGGTLTPLLRSRASKREGKVAVKVPFEFSLPVQVSEKRIDPAVPQPVQQIVTVQRADKISTFARAVATNQRRAHE